MADNTNRGRSRAIRSRMASTGEPWTIAARRVDATPDGQDQGSTAVTGSLDPIGYQLRHGELVQVRITTGTPEYVTLLGCEAEVVAIEYDDDGTPSEEDVDASTWVVELRRRDPNSGDRVTTQVHVAAGDWDDGTWLKDVPWPDVFRPGTQAGRRDTVNAVRLASRSELVRTPVYVSPGWRELEPGRWMFVHANGGITAGGEADVRTRFDQACVMVDLPTPARTDAAAREAAAASVRLLRELPPRYSAPLLGAVFAAPVRQSPMPLHLQGGSDSAKTSLLSLVSKHFTPGLDQGDGMMNAAGAPAHRIRDAMYRSADCILFLDDVSNGPRKTAITLADIARASVDKTRRISLDQSGQVRRSGVCRATVIASGEAGASTEAVQARLFELAVTPASIDIGHLADMHEHADMLALNLASYLQWLAGGDRLEQARNLVDWHRREPCNQPGEGERLILRWLDDGQPNRIAATLAHLAGGWLVFLSYLADLGCTDDDLQRLWADVDRGLRNASRTRSGSEREASDVDTVNTAGRTPSLPFTLYPGSRRKGRRWRAVS